MTIPAPRADHDSLTNAFAAPPAPTSTPKAGTNRQPRDSASAVARAQARIQAAEHAATAVAKFHEAADQLDQAESLRQTATRQRAEALHELKRSGLRITEICDLTGLSRSRIQALLRTNTQPQAPKHEAFASP